MRDIAPSRGGSPLLVVAGVFFLSGISGLMYQVLWLRLLSVVFGVTAYAASTVLASFMCGLAVGSVLAGRLADRTRDPLRWFGLVELGIGASALLTPWLLDAAQVLYTAIATTVPDGQGAVLTLARFACSSAVLLVPTALMGATLPLVVRSSLVQRGDLGPRIGLLYAVNAGGAITGAILAGFYLIGLIGLRRTFLVAAGLNVLVAVTAFALSRRYRTTAEREDVDATPREALAPDSDAAETPSPAASGATAAVLLAVFAASGLASLA
ncbi:MAG TPA: fused MFS/spermidine synthase, partial [Luteitalea sp.]|nr:fused MFS/spermidine synthase [Luteitalea sp.]